MLIEEDDEILRSLTAEAISLLGLTVIDCASADEALVLLESPTPIALVMTDVCMPGSMVGLALAKVIWDGGLGCPSSSPPVIDLYPKQICLLMQRFCVNLERSRYCMPLLERTYQLKCRVGIL